MKQLKTGWCALVTVSCVMLASSLAAQAVTTTPESFFGHQIGADYVLPNYTRFTEFLAALEAESDRMTVVDIGATAEGRSQLMAIITSPENHANLDRYREISARLALARDLTDEEARALAREGKAVVWIDGGLHATEVLGPQQLMETIWQLVSRTDAETMRILDDVVILAAHANPDGMELVSDWYMRHEDPEERSTGGIPRLYQKYVGHDNNRDFFASTQPETENINRQLYRVWYPQIVYNHHQTGPAGTVMFAPPFRDPFNYVFDPLIITQLDLVGAAMHTRFEAEDKPGVTMRRGANYSTWWNGGLRTTPYFHNMIGLLTETIGNPTPQEIPFLANRQLANADLPFPIDPQIWHFRSSVDYSVTANYAVLDLASRYRETFLFNIYQMGRNAIRKGSQDSWTMYPNDIERATAVIEAMRDTTGGGGGTARLDLERSMEVWRAIRQPEDRDPRAFIISPEQDDFPTAVKFVNALLETGVEVRRARSPFVYAGRTYPAGTLVVPSAQAFRAHVLDMFEPQDHPNDFAYPGGPPIRPYDVAGWTLAFTMGVEFERALEGVQGSFETITEWNLAPPAGTVGTAPDTRGYLLSPAYADGFGAVYGLLSSGEEVYRLTTATRAGEATYPVGSYYIRAGDATREKLEEIAGRLGLDFAATNVVPGGEHVRMRAPRIALWDRYGGSMPSGWTRWILEQNGIPFDVVFAPRLDEGDLRDEYDAIIFVDGAIPAPPREDGQGGGGGAGAGSGPNLDGIPEEYHQRVGSVTAGSTIPRLKEFLEDGGTIVTIGSSTSLARHLGLPVTSHLVTDDGEPLSANDFYVPGSVLSLRLDPTDPIAWGMGESVDVLFDSSPVFALEGAAGEAGVRRVGWFDTAEPLRSGWAWGQEYLEDGAAAVAAPVGDGTLLLFGPEILFRAQPYGTFNFLFNALSLSRAEEAAVR